MFKCRFCFTLRCSVFPGWSEVVIDEQGVHYVSTCIIYIDVKMLNPFVIRKNFEGLISVYTKHFVQFTCVKYTRVHIILYIHVNIFGKGNIVLANVNTRFNFYFSQPLILYSHVLAGKCVVYCSFFIPTINISAPEYDRQKHVVSRVCRSGGCNHFDRC